MRKFIEKTYYKHSAMRVLLCPIILVRTLALRVIHSLVKLYHTHSFVRRFVSPLRTIKRAAKRKMMNGEIQQLHNLQKIFVGDPMIRVDEFDGVFELDIRSDLFSRLLFEGKYEPELADICKRLVNKDRDVIDVGANIGFFSVLFAKKLGASNKVLSIEPTKNAKKRLYANICRNNVEDKVVVFEGVASNKSGATKIKTIAGMEEYSSLGSMNHPVISKTAYVTEEVRSSTIDDLKDKFSLDPGFIKIDVEGVEHLVFEGAQNVLIKNRPMILSELSDDLLGKNGSSSKKVIDMIRQLNYTVIDPIHPDIMPGQKDFGDILCIPNEMMVGNNIPYRKET